MSFILSLFSKKRTDEDWESVLANLASDIQKREVKLSEIRLRERRSTLLVTLYTLAGWMVYLTLWYFGALPKHGDDSGTRRIQKAIQAAPVIVGPIIILFIRRIVQVWYARKGNAEEKTLQQLRKQQRSKVEEIKKKTNYYSTRDLLQRYDEPPNSPGLRQRVANSAPSGMPQQPVTPRRQQAPGAVSRTSIPIQNPTSNLALQPSLPPRKQWYDKVADALLGDDDHTPNASASRYALICEKCFSHNGLVKETLWADTQYLCPKCGHFNASAKSRKQMRSQESSPVSTLRPSSVCDRKENGHPSPQPTEPLVSDAKTSPKANLMDVDAS